MTDHHTFSHRLATIADLSELRTLMEMSIRKLVGAYLDEAHVEASFEFDLIQLGMLRRIFLCKVNSTSKAPSEVEDGRLIS